MTDTESRATNRLRPLVAAVLVACLVVGAAVPAAGLLADSPTAATDGATTGATAANTDAVQTGDPGGNESDGNVTASAGARLAGAIGSQQSEAAGELETRTLVVRLGRADSLEERAAVLALLEARTDARLASLRERRERLRAAADNRSVSAGAYAYAAATVSVEAAVNRRLADRGERATAALPAAVTAEYGLSVERFRNLSNRSRSVTADLRVPGRSGLVAELTDGIDTGEGVDATDLLDEINQTVGPANRTDWPFDGNDSTLGAALDELAGENESLDLDGVIDDDPNESDGLFDGNATDGDDVFGNATDGSDDPFAGTLDGNATDEDGLLDGTDDGILDDDTGTATDDSSGDDGLFDDDTADDDETTDDGLFGG
jgi:hypothetical protein